tara:strand:- start:841 stop:1842 length:1002 start_codon:yes stop_codon:yes gene_type:complete
MKLAIDYYPLLKYYHAGPKVFLNRLKDSIIKQNLCNVKTPFLPFFDIALFSVYKKNFYKKNYVIRVDGIYFDNKNVAGETKILNDQIIDSIKKSVGIIYISDFSKKMVHNFFGNFNLPEIVIHNKVPLQTFNPEGDNYFKKLGFKDNDRVLITSAHWRRHKRLKETIKLIRILNKQSKFKYKLIVLGKNNDPNNNDKNIYYAGEIKPMDLPKWYRTAHVYVHLAWIEPCGNTQVEAMACGLPVICCNNGGIGETVIEANGGIVVNSDPIYNMNYIDYYNPPEPNYEELINSINKIFDQYPSFKKNIKSEILDIDYGARSYVNFIKNVSFKKNY